MSISSERAPAGEYLPAQSPHELVAPLINHLINELPAQLPANLAGLYLRGSLVTGDFRPDSSDIDLLAVTYRRVNEEEFARLAAMHNAIAERDDPFARRIEIEYIDRTALRRYVPGERFPSLDQGETLQWSEHQANWIIERWMVREQGIALFGPLPITLIDPIAPHLLRAAVAVRLQDWAAWASNLDDPEWHLPRSHKFYVVETMCRALHTLATGTVVSKPAAAVWARKALPEPWRALVEGSQGWRLDKTVDDSLILPVRAFVMWASEQGAGGDPAAGNVP